MTDRAGLRHSKDKRRSRKRLYEWQKGRCFLCDGKMTLADPRANTYATFEHLRPTSRGEKHSRTNRKLAYRKCNQAQGNKTLQEWHEYMDSLKELERALVS
jgi:CRISPR/Cas system Type II protein with McrA/HNH and RuvC-like nuclease domain